MPSIGPGFKQNATSYFTVISSIGLQNYLTYTPGTGSGGATTAGSFAPYNTASLGTTFDLSTAVKAGNSFKDMGKTVVSSSRVFRKVQAMTGVVNAGALGTAVPNVPDYLVGYLELASDAGQAPNALARF